ncbi:hypothetical protein [Nocardioides okcheonensis]|uniref:hypothetical protein n=1 Tax=Nocardioides okcheonensis TaxID=2894081 RepID=UPI001E5E68DE|nr:hypothetical protein [Nocardioides okcheonensis]UFN45132.1 hypothetical protein LN652_02615 [Nocardioides okcheonensis]
MAREDLSPLEPSRDIGWLLTLLSAVGVLWSSWGLFPNDPVGNAAGTWVSAATTIAIMGTMWLRATDASSAVAVTALAGGTLLLLGALRDYPTSVTVTMVGGGAGIVVGAIMQVRHAPGTR